MMTTPAEFVGIERKHLKAVREKLTAAVTQTSKGDASFVPFYIAIADYMEASMGRLHDQDVKLGETIRAKAEDAVEAENRLQDLKHRLAGSQDCLRVLLEARDVLEQEGAAALGQFETAGEAYSNYIQTKMGHQGPISELAASLLTPEDWEYIAGVTDDAVEREEELYDHVSETIPDSLELLGT